jgi:hypothetical protein
MENKEVRDKFISLIGVEEVESLEENWCEFDIHEKNEIKIKFLEKDGKNDTVIYSSIHYNEDTEEWYSKNSVVYPYLNFKTYKEMKDHLISLEGEILNNGNSIIDFS